MKANTPANEINIYKKIQFLENEMNAARQKLGIAAQVAFPKPVRPSVARHDSISNTSEQSAIQHLESLGKSSDHVEKASGRPPFADHRETITPATEERDNQTMVLAPDPSSQKAQTEEPQESLDYSTKPQYGQVSQEGAGEKKTFHNSSELSIKSKTVAVLLSLLGFVGLLGFHRIYFRKFVTGLSMMVLWFFAFWFGDQYALLDFVKVAALVIWFVDVVRVIFGKF